MAALDFSGVGARSTGFDWIEIGEPPAEVTRSRFAGPDLWVNWLAAVVGAMLGITAGLAALESRFGTGIWVFSDALVTFLAVGIPTGLLVFLFTRWYIARTQATPKISRIHRVSASGGMLWIEMYGSHSHWIALEELQLSEAPVAEDWYRVTYPGRGSKTKVFFVPWPVAFKLRPILADLPKRPIGAPR